MIWLLRRAKLLLLLSGMHLYNFLLSLRPSRKAETAGSPDLEAIRRKAEHPTDFSDHLVRVFAEALSARPKLIVELGTRGGESTFVLERAARLTGAALVSVDLDDCSRASSYPGWHFVQGDDVRFGKDFPRWAGSRKLPEKIDLLFIDTSHEYEHTREEIRTWFPLVAETGKVILHDTNLRYFFFHRDGSLGTSGWDNQRGVIRALEEHFAARFREDREFTDLRDGWLIRHWPYGSGLTVLQRVGHGQG